MPILIVVTLKNEKHSVRVEVYKLYEGFSSLLSANTSRNSGPRGTPTNFSGLPPRDGPLRLAGCSQLSTARALASASKASHIASPPAPSVPPPKQHTAHQLRHLLHLQTHPTSPVNKSTSTASSTQSSTQR